MSDYPLIYWPGFYPKDEQRRTEIRLRNYENAMHRAVITSLRMGYSMRCARGDHGCLNDGSNCLCLCHDRRPS